MSPSPRHPSAACTISSFRTRIGPGAGCLTGMSSSSCRRTGGLEWDVELWWGQEIITGWPGDSPRVMNTTRTPIRIIPESGAEYLISRVFPWLSIVADTIGVSNEHDHWPATAFPIPNKSLRGVGTTTKYTRGVSCYLARTCLGDAPGRNVVEWADIPEELLYLQFQVGSQGRRGEQGYSVDGSRNLINFDLFQEEKKILFYHPPDVSLDTKMRDVGFSEAIINFTR